MNDVVGKKFGRLMVLPDKAAHGNSYVMCICDCGSVGEYYKGNLVNGRTKSCGCLKSESSIALGKKRLVDLTGETFGEWAVLYRAESVNSQTMWHCRCTCGIERDVNGGRLRDGTSTSCGHARYADLTGKRFGHWDVIKKSARVRPNGRNCATYLCRCTCGNMRIVDSSSLVQGISSSCGCFNSKGQQAVIEELEALGINYDTEVWFPDLIGTTRPLRFDFALYDSKGEMCCLLEFQGKQHYDSSGNENFGKMQREYSDSKKRAYCTNKKIPLFEIKYCEDIHSSIATIIQKCMPTLCQAPLHRGEGPTTIRKE